jgi:hypothetical protein
MGVMISVLIVPKLISKSRALVILLTVVIEYRVTNVILVPVLPLHIIMREVVVQRTVPAAIVPVVHGPT